MAVETEKKMANAIRFLSMDAIQAANSGHPGMPMGMADVATVLFNRFMNIDPSAPDWRNRDRFVLSAGHGSMLLYSVHHLLGYDDMDIEQIKNFRQLGSRTAGHPEFGHADGIEATTGPLGQGITMATGMALGERILNARLGDDVMNHFTYVIAGDGCLMEGISQEAIDFAGLMKLSKLIVLWDDNDITIDGSTSLSTVTDQKARFEASKWHVISVDGHDNDAIAAAIEVAQTDPRPSLIACKTVIGYGAPNKAGSHKVHGAPLGAEEIEATRKALGWAHEAFEVPKDIYDAWHSIAARGKAARIAWDDAVNGNVALANSYADHRAAVSSAMAEYRAKLVLDQPKLATRVASQKALEVVNATLPNSIGGSADLTPSNNTFTDGMSAITPENFAGDYIHYGIREHAMGAIMNGLALHGGLRPYGGTFLIFSDYARPAIRLSALMSQPVNYVLTHDSIGLGEDGPTHQPVEILAALRAIPNLNVFRPCDAVETAEAWEIGANSTTTPSAHALSRQGLPALRNKDSENLTVKGAYVLRETNGARDVTIIATGSEVSLAVEAAEKLAEKGVRAAVVSAPCFALFAAQDKAYQDSVVGTAPRIGVEAAIRSSWDLFLDRDDAFIGMTGFGASAPAEDLYQHFGITVDAIVDAALAKTGK